MSGHEAMTTASGAAVADYDEIVDLLANRESDQIPVRVTGCGVPVGEYAPAFVLPRGDDRSCGLADLMGAPFVLHFFSGAEDTWLRQSDCLKVVTPALAELGVALVGIICAERSQLRHLESVVKGYSLLLDWEPKALVSRIYGFNHTKASPGISATYLVDRRGVVRWIAFNGAEGRGDPSMILNAARLHLTRPSTVDTSD